MKTEQHLEGDDRKHPPLSIEHLNRLNHFSRIQYLELQYAGYCRQLKDGIITREYFDKMTKKVLTLLSNKRFLTGGDVGVYGRYSRAEIEQIADGWKEVMKEKHDDPNGTSGND